MSDRSFKVPSLDGGGIQSFFSAALLTQIEESTRKSVKDHFDLIVGTSTGAIIALGIASGMSAAQILDFYQKRGLEIFSKPRRFPCSLFRPRYKNEPLIAALKEIFGDENSMI